MAHQNHNEKADYIFGRLPAINALESGKALKAYLQKGFSDERIISLCNNNKIQVMYVEADKLSNLSRNGNHQGVVLEVKPFEYSDLASIINVAKKKENPLIVILDEIEDPHNFGAILRSCDAFGVDGILIKSRNQVLVTSTVAKVSTGAIEYLRIAQVNNLSTAISKLKENGFWIYAADGSGKDDYQKLDYKGPVALIVGSEGRGISRLVLDNSDFIIKIPMFGHVNSLNVSVATGILLSRIRNN